MECDGPVVDTLLPIAAYILTYLPSQALVSVHHSQDEIFMILYLFRNGWTSIETEYLYCLHFSGCKKIVTVNCPVRTE